MSDTPADSVPLDDVLCVLGAAIAVIRQWHGPEAWDLYYSHSPEMKPIRDWLKEQSQIGVSQCNDGSD